MSNTSASLLLIVLMLGLAIYFMISPPPGFETFGHRVALPFILVACAFSVLENLRTRTHISQLVGALRGLMGRSGAPPTPEVKKEAVEILLRSMRSDKETVRKTAAEQLRQLTGENLGDTAEAWEQWWEANKKSFGKS